MKVVFKLPLLKRFNLSSVLGNAEDTAVTKIGSGLALTRLILVMEGHSI